MNNSFWKSHFLLNKRQRNGIFFLILSIIILQYSIYELSRRSLSVYDLNSEELILFKKEFDSLVSKEKNKSGQVIYPFNPNYLSDYKGYQIGMSTAEIDRLFFYRNRGNFVNSKTEFQEVTGVSDSLLNAIAPYFKFPTWVSRSGTTPKKAARTVENVHKTKRDINLATPEELKTIHGIGEKLSLRIVNYRRRLIGFSEIDQLHEVWGLKPEVINRLLESYAVLSFPQIDKLNVNTASFKELLNLVYIDYELCKKIVEYREEVAEIQSLDELKKIDGFPIKKFDRIALYLVAQ
jgi:DNA uptake protein ComE-like DNA-binding protein